MPVAESLRQSKGEERWAVNQGDLSIYFILEHHLCQHESFGFHPTFKKGDTIWWPPACPSLSPYAHPLQYPPSSFPDISAPFQSQKPGALITESRMSVNAWKCRKHQTPYRQSYSHKASVLVKKKLNISRRRKLEGKTPQTTWKHILEGEKHT